MVCKNRGICGFLGTSWVLSTYNICPPGVGKMGATLTDSLLATRTKEMHPD